MKYCHCNTCAVARFRVKSHYPIDCCCGCTLSLPSSVVKISFPVKAPFTIDTIPLLVLVVLVVSVSFGKVSILFPDMTN
jgi:hypothetical protein